jgi:hypothetical protein
MLRQQIPRVTLIGLGVIVVSLILGAEVWHFTLFHHPVGYGWHADLAQREGDIGIPGVSTLSVARIFNYTLLPQNFEGVHLPGGYIGSGVVYRSQIEKWNEQTRLWAVVVQPDPSDWKAFPHTTTKVWPGRSIYAAGWQAVGAIDGIKKGDRVRLVVFRTFSPAKAGEQESAVYSPAFIVTDERLSFRPALRLEPSALR